MKRFISAPITLATLALLSVLANPAQARMEKIGDLESGVAVSSDASFLTQPGRELLRTWILLDYKDEQRFDGSGSPLNPTPPTRYRSRKDYVQVDCRHNTYTELATQMFPDTEGKGAVVFESTYTRSPMPRFATPSSHEGVVLLFLCKGERPTN
jgi:hypothetical protein